MADNGIGNINPIIAQGLKDISQSGKSASQAKQSNADDNGIIRDKIEISRQAKAISKAMLYINQVQDIRTDLVEKAIKQRVTENQSVPTQVLAAKMLLED